MKSQEKTIMKKVLYLFLAIMLIECSDSSDNNVENIETPPPPTITFKVREVWGSKFSWNKDNLIFQYDRNMCSVTGNTLMAYSSSNLTGFETRRLNHFAIDTLVINMNAYPWEPSARFFDFRISDRLDIIYGGREQRHPKKIGHIEFIGFNSRKRLILEQSLLDTDIINGERLAQIDYFSSNLSEEFIESITYDGSGHNYYMCELKKVFNKKDYEENYYESTIINITVPEDEFNSDLNIGDIIGEWDVSNVVNKPLGEGWDSRFINLYYILDKE